MKELTDAEQLALRTMLEVLDGQPAELAEAGWHGLTEARLQVRVELKDFERLRDVCVAQRWVIGAKALTGRMRWVIGPAGRIALQQL